MKKNLLRTYALFLFLIFTFFTHSVFSASRYWIASSASNWNNTANWSTSAAGSGGSSVPSTSDDVYFTSSRNGNCTIDAVVSISGIDINGYSGAITNTNYSFTVSSNNYFTQSSGTFNGGTSNITINARLSISGGTFNAGSGILDINGTGFYLTGGVFNSTSGNFFLSSGWNHTTGGTFNHNSGTVVFDGSTDINSCKITIIGNTETFNNLTFNLTSGSKLMYSNNDNLIVLGTLTLSGGSIAPWNGGYSVSLEARGDVTITSSFGTTSADVTIVFGGSTILQNFNLTGATDKLDGHIKINKSIGGVKLLSNITMNASNQNFTLLAGILNLNGKTVDNSSGGTMFVNTSTTIVSGTGNLYQSNYSQSGGNIDFNGTSITLKIYNDFTITGGSFNADTATVDIDRIFSLTTGTFNAPSGNMYVGAGWYHGTSGTFNHNFGTVTFDGTHGSWYLMDFVTQEIFYNVIVNKGSCSYNKIESDGDNMIVEGNLSLLGGWIWSRTWETTGGSNKNKIKVRGNITIDPNYCNSSYPPTLIFICDAVQNLDLTGLIDNYDGDIIINKNGGSVKLISNFTMNRSGGQQLIIGNGTFNLNGFTLNIGTSSTVTKYSGGTLNYNGGSITGGTVTNSGDSYGMDPNSCSALPVKLLYLVSENKTTQILINWATASEIDNDYFLVERSFDGKIFETIGQIKGSGNSQQIIKYSFLDLNPSNLINYYRLKQVDFNGNFEYSKIIAVNNSVISNPKNILKVYPNPSNNLINIEISSGAKTEVQFIVIDVTGKEILNGQVLIYKALDISAFYQGIYTLQILEKNGQLIDQKRFMVTR